MHAPVESISYQFARSCILPAVPPPLPKQGPDSFMHVSNARNSFDRYLSRTQNGNAAYLALKSYALVDCALSIDGWLLNVSSDEDGFRADTHCRCFDRLWDHRQVVQALLDQEPNNPVRVEQEVPPAGVLVSDDGVEGLELGGLREREDVWRKRGGRALRGRCVLDKHGSWDRRE